MKPLCKKIYISKIVEIVVLIIGSVLDTFLIVNMGEDLFFLIFIIPFTATLLYFLLDSIYWIFQPNVLVYQYETGIVIERNKKIEYTDIKEVYFKNYIHKKPYGHYYRDTYSGIIYIKLKSGKLHKIRNAFYPMGVVDVISRIKQQRKFK